MTEDRFSRTRLLVGEDGLARLAQAVVLVAGLGGVGGYVVEAIARAGVGRIVLLDFDRVAESNLNRQILATTSTLGMRKVDAAAERVAQIQPGCEAIARDIRLVPGNVANLLTEDVTHVVDAIDDVTAKIALLTAVHERGLPHAACMGAGGMVEPSGIEVADISRTQGCPLARAVRLRLRKLGISNGIRCIYTPRPRVPAQATEGTERPLQGTLSFMPGLIGLTAAGVIIRDIVACDTHHGLLE